MVGVGVSGGSDSVALLRILCEVREQEGIRLAVLHFNHGLRGADSDGDEKFVAEFVGRSTFIEGRMDAPGRFVSAGGLSVACEGSATGSASLALRPERLALMTQAAPAMDNNFPGSVEFISYLGSQVDLHVRLSPRERVIVQIQNRPEQALPAIGEQVQIGWSKSTGRVFPL